MSETDGYSTLASWSAWMPFVRAVQCAPRTPGVYVVRVGEGPIVYVGMAGERRGQGIRGRLTVYARAIMLDARDKRGLERDAARGDMRAHRALVRLLAEAGDLDALADRARVGDEFAAALHDRLLFVRGDADGLRESAERTENPYAAWLLSELFATRADLDRLDAHADEGDVFAAQARTRLLFDRGDRGRLESLSSSGDKYATVALIRSIVAEKSATTIKALKKAAPTLAEQFPRWLDNTRTVEVIAVKANRHEMWTNPNAKAVLLTRTLVEPKADPTALHRVLVEEEDVVTLARLTELGWSWAALPLASLLSRAGKDEEALLVLEIAADDGDTAAAATLAHELSRYGDTDRLRERAKLGDRYAAEGLASALLADDRLGELLIRAGAGDGFALDLVVDRPVVTGDPDTARRLLQPWADAGNPHAALALWRILYEAGQPDAAEVLTPFADSGLTEITARLVALAYESRDVQRLRGYADSGNRHAALRLALVLYKQQDRDALQREVCANNTDHAAQFLLRLYRDANDDAERPVLSLTPDGSPDPDDWAA